MEWCHGGKVTKIPDSNLIQDRSTSRLSDPSITRNFPQLTGGLRAWCCNTSGRSSLIRCLVWHGRRRWFQKICESMHRSNVFCSWIITFILQPTTEKYSVGKHRWINWKVFSCQTSSNQVKSIQLTNIVESTGKGSVMGSTEISTYWLTFAFLRLPRFEVFWNALDPMTSGPCNVLSVAVATKSSSSRIVSRAAQRGVGFLADFLRSCDGRDILDIWIHSRCHSFVTDFDNESTATLMYV